MTKHILPLLLGLPLLAAAPSAGAPAAGGKVRITSTDGFVLETETRTIVFRTGVEVTQEGFRMHCDTLVARYKEDEGKRQVERMSGSGNVRCVQEKEGITVESDTVDYDSVTGDLVFRRTGAPVLARQQGNTLSGEEIRYNRTTGNMSASGNSIPTVVEFPLDLK